MVKTKHLVIGAAALSVTILTLYKIVQPDNHIIKFSRSNVNQTSNGGSASLTKILTTIKLDADSPARKMFENELSRISENLKSGRIADENPYPPVLYYKHELSQQEPVPVQPNVFYYKSALSQQEPEVVQPNVAEQLQALASLHNQVVAANVEEPSVQDQQKKQNIQNIKLPSDLNVNAQSVNQNVQSPNVVKTQNIGGVQLPKNPAKQGISNSKNIQMSNAQTLQGWKVIPENARIQGNQAGPRDPQINQSANQHQQKPMEALNDNADSVWQPIKQKSQLSDLVQSVQKDSHVYKTF